MEASPSVLEPREERAEERKLRREARRARRAQAERDAVAQQLDNHPGAASTPAADMSTSDGNRRPPQSSSVTEGVSSSPTSKRQSNRRHQRPKDDGVVVKGGDDATSLTSMLTPPPLPVEIVATDEGVPQASVGSSSAAILAAVESAPVKKPKRKRKHRQNATDGAEAGDTSLTQSPEKVLDDNSGSNLIAPVRQAPTPHYHIPIVEVAEYGRAAQRKMCCFVITSLCVAVGVLTTVLVLGLRDCKHKCGTD